MHDSDATHRLARWVRGLALVTLVAGCVAYSRANDAEASAIFRAGGDAGLWGVGLMFALILLIPGGVLLLASLVLSPQSPTGARVAALAGVALLGATAWLASTYPPDKVTDEGRRLRPALWEHTADLYLLAFVLLGAAGVLVLGSAFVRSGSVRSDSTPGPSPT